ncbi:MAG: tRNA (adenosine(37)-N6)-threonylcarbamoyltransferase complex dimerization subunit type 1 TsaB [Sphingobacterium sp.]
MSKNYILSIETATTSCSVSLASDGEHIATIIGEAPNLHSSKLTVFIQDLLTGCGLTMKQLSAVAVSKGPGSYTGLRIGVSTAKGLCYAMDIPLIGIGTLEALVAGYLEPRDGLDKMTLLCPMIDARRREVYTAIYHSDGEWFQPTQALIVDEHTFDDYLQQGHQLILFGSGADKFAETFDGHPQVHVHTNFDSFAAYQDKIAYQAYQQRRFENVAYFEPFYLKDFVASTPKRSPLL